MSELWNSVAAQWEAQATFVDAHLAEVTEVLLDLAGVGPGSVVLELACGPGGVGLRAAERVGPGGRVVLADVAEEMVAVAGRRAAGRDTVTTMVCDQAAIDAPDAAFDAVVSRHGLMFAEDHGAAVREAVRVLRPGGRFAAATWGRREDNPWLGLILDAVGEQFGVPFPPPGVPGPFALDDAERLAGVLRGGGLTDVGVRVMEVPMTADSLDAWWERVPQLAGPLAVALAGMEPEVRDAIRDRALAAGAAAARATGAGVELAGAALIGAGRREADGASVRG